MQSLRFIFLLFLSALTIWMPSTSFLVHAAPSETITWAIKYDANDTSLGLYARFCDSKNETQGEAKSLKIAVSPWKTTKLCVDLLNQLDQEATIHVSFVDAKKDDVGWVIGCSAEDTRWVFWQYVSGYEVTYKVPAFSFQRIEPEIKMPASSAGTIYWCVSVYNDKVYGEKIKKSWMTTLVRNALAMEVFVDSKVDVGLELSAVEDIDGYNLVSEPMHISKQTNG